MDANTPTGNSDLAEALSRVRHEKPVFWLQVGVYEKKGGGNKFNHDADAMIEKAKTTGWSPITPSPTPQVVGSAVVHVALQDLGVGLGHELYHDMMENFHPSRFEGKSKQKFANELGLGHLTNGATFKDLMTMAMTTYITREYYQLWGNMQMELREKRDKRAITEKHKQKQREETLRADWNSRLRVPMMRPLPFAENYKEQQAELKKQLDDFELEKAQKQREAAAPRLTRFHQGNDVAQHSYALGSTTSSAFSNDNTSGTLPAPDSTITPGGAEVLARRPINQESTASDTAPFIPAKRRATKPGTTKITISKLEELIEALRARDRQFCDVSEILAFVDGEPIRSGGW